MSELLKVNVNDHTEKKNGLTYLSWAWAWAEVLKVDPQATWWAVDWTGEDGKTVPYMVINGTAMVKTVVRIRDIERECLLPVMDHRNKAIKDPDAFAVNTAIMRCMTKAISMHGLGLYIYAGEDLPEGEEAPPGEPETPKVKRFGSSGTNGPVEVPEDRQRVIQLAASIAIHKFKKGDRLDAYDEISGITENEEKLYLWQLLKAESAFRAFIKDRAAVLRGAVAEDIAA